MNDKVTIPPWIVPRGGEWHRFAVQRGLTNDKAGLLLNEPPPEAPVPGLGSVFVLATFRRAHGYWTFQIFRDRAQAEKKAGVLLDQKHFRTRKPLVRELRMFEIREEGKT
ncbi:MAG: hypothetical protein A3E78_09210 [Alphaproteobacteria bacterium RIFCSPHIGHO2_12_FULL_63_12]|nr:MAG: hypothetical protein A3E78_09210 [Alphaproteobacteria bacterium RIFCSPHIGHO2_12_FULL_63_12]